MSFFIFSLFLLRRYILFSLEFYSSYCYQILQLRCHLVTASVNGKHELVELTIDPEAVDPDDVEMLQDMVIAAVNEAMRTADAEAANNMSRLTGGLNLGGLF